MIEPPRALSALPFVLALLLTVVAACTAKGNTDVTGTIARQNVTAKTAAMSYEKFPLTSTSQPYDQLTLLVGTYSFVCPAWQLLGAPSADIPVDGGTTLAIVISSSPGPIEPGTYTITSPSANPLGGQPTPTNPAGADVQVSLVQYDAMCSLTDEETAMSGTITLSSVNGDGAGIANGSLDLTFADGSVHGPFSGTPCDSAPASLDASAPSGDAAAGSPTGSPSGVTFGADGCLTDGD